MAARALRTHPPHPQIPSVTMHFSKKLLNHLPNQLLKIKILSKIINLVLILIVRTPRNQLHIANEFVSHPPMLNNSKVALLFQMNKRTNFSFLRVFRQPRKKKQILEMLEWTKKWWKSAA